MALQTIGPGRLAGPQATILATTNTHPGTVAYATDTNLTFTSDGVTAGTWSLTGSGAIGPQGTQGSTGYSGPVGPTTQGITGPIGATGTQGSAAQGPQGRPGSRSGLRVPSAIRAPPATKDRRAPKARQAARRNR